MVNLKVTVGANVFEFATDAGFSEVHAFLEWALNEWFKLAAMPPPVLHGTLQFDEPTDQPVP